MEYEYLRTGLMPTAPIGVGGICPICDGNLDGMTWALCPNDGEHEERCRKCCTLITINKKGKVKKEEYSEQRENYLRYSTKKEESTKVTNQKIEALKREKSHMGFFRKNLTNRCEIIHTEIDELIDNEGGLSFSNFKEY